MNRRATLLVALVLLAGSLALAKVYLSPAPPVRVEAPHVYDGCGSLCYLGAFAMVTPDPVPYEVVVRRASPWRIASGTEIMAQAALNLGYTVVVDRTAADDEHEVEGARHDPLARLGEAGRPGQVLADEAAALAELRRRLEAGRAVMVHVDLAPLLEERRRASPRYPDVGHAGHYLVVTGMDSQHVYVHDPQFEEGFARHQPLRLGPFLEAWEAGDHQMYTVVRSGDAAPPEQLLAELRAHASEGPRELQALAEQVREEATLSGKPFLALSSGAYRREALASWLEEAGEGEAAALYRNAADLYRSLHPAMDARAAESLLERILQLEEEAAALLRAGE